MIGIIAAENEEMKAILNLMSDIKEEKIYNLTFYIGKVHSKDVALVECGVGKVNSARVTQILIDKYNPDVMLNVGVAGGLNPELNVGDMVVSESLIQYDFDATSLGKYEKGEVCDTGRYFKADERLINIAKSVLEEENINFIVGKIATADIFVSEVDFQEYIRSEFDCECTEMEGAAMAQVCFLCNIPFVVIRGISDTKTKILLSSEQFGRACNTACPVPNNSFCSTKSKLSPMAFLTISPPKPYTIWIFLGFN